MYDYEVCEDLGVFAVLYDVISECCVYGLKLQKFILGVYFVPLYQGSGEGPHVARQEQLDLCDTSARGSQAHPSTPRGSSRSWNVSGMDLPLPGVFSPRAQWHV